MLPTLWIERMRARATGAMERASEHACWICQACWAFVWKVAHSFVCSSAGSFFFFFFLRSLSLSLVHYLYPLFSRAIDI